MTILPLAHAQNVVHDVLCRKHYSSSQLKGQSPLVLVCNNMDMGLTNCVHDDLGIVNHYIPNCKRNATFLKRYIFLYFNGTHTLNV